MKAFFGFDEDGNPKQPEVYGIEDVVLERADIMSYRGHRPICAICQLNFDTIFISGEEEDLHKVLEELRDHRDRLWPEGH